jgi:lipopolysaccharide export system protein LptC
MTVKNYVYLVIATLLSWWLVKLTGLDEIINTSHAPPHSPDYYSKGYIKWEMNENGQLKSKLQADQMFHYRDDGSTVMVKPLMYSYDQKNPPWVMASESGIMSADGKNLQLNGSVSIDRTRGVGLRPLRINTSNLKVKPETSYAETVEWAELISPPNKTTGTGMKMTYAQPIHLELLSQVKGKYETK